MTRSAKKRPYVILFSGEKIKVSGFATVDDALDELGKRWPGFCAEMRDIGAFVWRSVDACNANIGRLPAPDAVVLHEAIALKRYGIKVDEKGVMV